jgi:hypothetical protein
LTDLIVSPIALPMAPIALQVVLLSVSAHDYPFLGLIWMQGDEN